MLEKCSVRCTSRTCNFLSAWNNNNNNNNNNSLTLTKLPPRILTHIQQDAMLHSLYYLETALHVSGGTTTQHQERKQLYLQHLVFVTPLLRCTDP